jgi:hypothetical protein
VLTALFCFASCSWFGAREKYRTDSDRTTFRSAEDNPAETATPAPQKIPGESKKASPARQ